MRFSHVLRGVLTASALAIILGGCATPTPSTTASDVGDRLSAPESLTDRPSASPAPTAVQGPRLAEGTAEGQSVPSEEGHVPVAPSVDDFAPVLEEDPEQRDGAMSFSASDAQAALDAIPASPTEDPVVGGNVGLASYEQAMQTESLASWAASLSGKKVALISEMWRGLPDPLTGSPNSRLWWVTTSEPTGFGHTWAPEI